ncbi:MAG: hypothetical protein AAFO07_02055 [Bacteroidota bacterium]
MVILTNCENVQNLDIIAAKLAALTMGQPYELNKIILAQSSLESINGIYEDEYGAQKIVRFEDHSLLIFDRGKTKNKLIPFGERKFFIENTLTTWSVKQEKGETFLEENNTNQIIKWKRVDGNIKSISLKEVSIENLRRYIGKYELRPNFFFEVKLQGNALIGQIRDEKKELMPIGNHEFIARDIDAKLIFNLENIRVISLTLDQGRKMTAKKME